MLQQLIDEVVAGLGQFIALVLGLGDSWAGESISSLSHLMCITALAIPPNIVCRKKRGQFSCGIPGPDDIMVRGARTHIGLTLTVAQPSDTNMVTDFSLDPEHTCGI